MSVNGPFQKKSADSTVDESCFRGASKHLKTFCHSTEYSKSRNSAEAFVDFSKLDDPPAECLSGFKRSKPKSNCNKPRSKRRTIKEFKTKAHTRHHSRETQELGDFQREFKTKTLQSEMLNCSYQIENSSSLIGLRSCTVVCEPISSLVASINVKLSEVNARNLVISKLQHHDNEMALFIRDDIQRLKKELHRLKTQNERLTTIQKLNMMYCDQRRRIESIEKMELQMMQANMCKPPKTIQLQYINPAA